MVKGDEDGIEELEVKSSSLLRIDCAM